MNVLSVTKHEAIIKEYSLGNSIRTIAISIQVARNTVRRHLKIQGLKSRTISEAMLIYHRTNNVARRYCTVCGLSSYQLRTGILCPKCGLSRLISIKKFEELNEDKYNNSQSQLW